jgi:tripartite-type tricarboxylate transporter receptor subunit TctC
VSLMNHKMNRRKVVRVAIGAFAQPAIATIAGGLTLNSFAQTYPSKTIKLIVGFPPGGGIDFTARTIQPGLETALKQTVIIEYKAGAGGVIAAGELLKAAPDGYTLLIANTGPFAIAPYLQAKRPYDPRKDFSYIGQIAESSYIACVRADHPARDLPSFVAWAKANSKTANFASGGLGSSTHLNGELLNTVSGLDLPHVPYRGSSPAVQDLIGGQVSILIDAGTVLLPQIKGGRLRAIAVTGSKREASLPDVATVKEQGFADMEAVGFQGLVGPTGMPSEIRAKLADELAKVLNQPEVKSKFQAAGSDVKFRGPDEFLAMVSKESERWSNLIRTRKISLD